MPVCPQCGHENPEGAKFCNACAAPLASATPPREQRKTVTVLFCDVVESTALGESTDPEALRTLVKGQSVDQARALLSPYGEVAIETWPAWVSSITGFDARLTVSVGGQTVDGPGSSPSGGPSSGSPRASTRTAASAAPAAPATSGAP